MSYNFGNVKGVQWGLHICKGSKPVFEKTCEATQKT